MMYKEDFESLNDLKKAYEITDEDLDGIEILYAVYRIGYYEGQSIVLFKKDSKLFIVDASHCSCNGLERCWNPIETTELALKKEIEAKSKWSYEEFESFIEFCKWYFKWKKNMELELK